MQHNDNEYHNNDTWYSGILNGIASALSKFVSVFKRNGLIYTTIVMILFICIYSLVINPIRLDKIVEKQFEQMSEQQKQKEQAAMTKRLKADEIISDVMNRLIDKFPNIHRCIMLEGHNSITSSTGTDLAFFSCTYEALTPNSRHLIYLSDDLQRQIRINLIGNNMTNTLKHREFLFYDNMKMCNHADHRIVRKLASTGDNESIFFPFVNDDNELVIILIISGDELPVNDIVEYVKEFRKQIEQCLM